MVGYGMLVESVEKATLLTLSLSFLRLRSDIRDHTLLVFLCNNMHWQGERITPHKTQIIKKIYTAIAQTQKSTSQPS